MSREEERMHDEWSRQLEKLLKLLLQYYSYDWEGHCPLQREIDQLMTALGKYNAVVSGFRDYFFQKLKASPLECFTLEETFELMFEFGCRSWLIELQKNTNYCDKLMIFFDTRCGQPSYFYSTNYSDPVPIHKMHFEDGDQDILFGIAKKKFGKKFTQINCRCILVANWNSKRKRWHLDKVYCFTGKGLVVLSS